MFKGLKEKSAEAGANEREEIRALGAYIGGLSGFFSAYPHNDDLVYNRKVASLEQCGLRLREIADGLQKTSAVSAEHEATK